MSARVQQELKVIPAGVVQERTKRWSGDVKDKVKYDDIESTKEKLMSTSKAKRDSVRDLGLMAAERQASSKRMVGPGALANFVNTSLRFSQRKDLDERGQTIRKGRKRSLKAVAKKMIFTMRLRVRKAKLLNVDEEKNVIFEVEHLNDYTSLEIMDIWFSEAEMQEIKWDNEAVAQTMDNGLSLKEADGRGLENITEEGNWNKYKIRKDAVNEVLDEFDQQMEAGIIEWDGEKLRAAYKEFSDQSLKEAQDVGLFDENEIEEYMADTRKELAKWTNLDRQKIRKRNKFLRQ